MVSSACFILRATRKNVKVRGAQQDLVFRPRQIDEPAIGAMPAIEGGFE